MVLHAERWAARRAAREDEGSLLGVERPEDTLRPDDRHGPPSPMPMGDQDVFDGCPLSPPYVPAAAVRGAVSVYRLGRRDLVDARSAAEYVVSDAGSMCRRQERQDMTWGVSAEIADGVERLIEQLGRHGPGTSRSPITTFTEGEAVLVTGCDPD